MSGTRSTFYNLTPEVTLHPLCLVLLGTHTHQVPGGQDCSGCECQEVGSLDRLGGGLTPDPQLLVPTASAVSIETHRAHSRKD